MRIKMYLQVGRMLHAMFILGAFLFYFFANKAIGAFQNNTILWSVVYAYFSLYGFTLLFFSQFDALSRYQNYKMVKDKIYEYGLQERLIKPFVYSRCQREAVLMASVAFDKKMECQKVFKKMGFKWFHILPRVLIRKPSLLFSKKYWSITLFASQYQSRYFFMVVQSIEITDISVRFKDEQVLNRISFVLKSGNITALIGPNGAGKSTCMKVLAGLVYPQSGSFSINNSSSNNVFSDLRKYGGFLIESPAFYSYMSAHQNLKIVAKNTTPKKTCRRTSQIGRA
jgi:ABC-type multidrug transport system fused ATPase/permease subunit